MRTLVLSDLHLGNQQGYDVFAGEQALPALIDRFTDQPTRVVLNGDTVDFLMNDDPLEMRIDRARAQAEALVGTESSRTVLHALGRILAADGEVMIRVGNHDIELALPEVQDLLIAEMGLDRRLALRTTFRVDDRPEVLKVGGARILVEHGERHDVANRVDHRRLERAIRTRDFSEFQYPPGSRLVKLVINPLSKLYQMRFTDLLKPWFQGSALAAMAVDASAVRQLLEGHGLSLGWQLFQNAGDGPMFFSSAEGEAPAEPELGLSEAIAEVELDDDERAALEELYSDDPFFFGAEDEHTRGSRRRALLKLGRAGLGRIASHMRGGGDEAPADSASLSQKAMAALGTGAGVSLAPERKEWEQALALAQEHRVGAIIQGHTHAARWGQAQGLTLINTGTWSDLLSLPPASADLTVWERFVAVLRGNPAMDPQRGAVPEVRRRFTAALIEPSADGARARLVELDARGQLETLGEGHVPA